jgi:hypothetical protein
MFNELNAVMVSVEYSDILRLTLPYNRHHFDNVVIITSHDDQKNVLPIAQANRAYVVATDAFYENGAHFNKWLALERTLDLLNLRSPGWLCLMDADVLWPKQIPCQLTLPSSYTLIPDSHKHTLLQPGFLYTPRRRMFPDIPTSIEKLPPESVWDIYPHHRNEAEFAGYSQIFHTSDPYLVACANCGYSYPSHQSHLNPDRQCPMFSWHETDWKHAGGADSFFQLRWPNSLKIRPAFDVLHLGPAGVNWCGRATKYSDGSVHPDSEKRKETMFSYMVSRRDDKIYGRPPYVRERLDKVPGGIDSLTGIGPDSITETSSRVESAPPPTKPDQA